MKRAALLIGCNYDRSPASVRLRGCIPDCLRMRNYLKRSRRYRDITLLTDHASHNAQGDRATRENILRQIRRLLGKSSSCKELFLGYSGHGVKLGVDIGRKDEKADLEGKVSDEAIVPLDYRTSGVIVDDQLYHILQKYPLRSKCRLIIVMDCCHSSSNLDLPYRYRILANNVWRSEVATKLRDPPLPGKIISITGCLDFQTSADVRGLYPNNEWSGALNYALLHHLRSNSRISIKKLLNRMNATIKSKGLTQDISLATNLNPRSRRRRLNLRSPLFKRRFRKRKNKKSKK